MNQYLAEFLGTAILVLLGNGVVANVVLRKTKGNNGGWIVISAGWGLAAYVAVVCVAPFSGAHINPAVTLGLAEAGKFSWSHLPGYVIAQFGGGFVGAVLVYCFYRLHYDATDDADSKLATFCTSPAIRSYPANFFSELLGTFVLVLTVLLAAGATFTSDDNGSSGTIGLGAVGALPVGLLVCAIGLCLGGTTGYAINPARDLSPRLAHAILPVAGKRDSDWSYSWIPVLGPLAGGTLAALLYRVTVTGPG
jgi:glycerol uptake facilitator protein